MIQTIGEREVQVVKGGEHDYDVYLPDPPPRGKLIGHIDKRREHYNLRSANGRSGATYTYWDAEGVDGRRVGTLRRHAGECGGEAMQRTNPNSGYIEAQCLRCEQWLAYDGDERYENLRDRFTQDKGRGSKTGASTRRDAVALLVKAYEAEAEDAD